MEEKKLKICELNEGYIHEGPRFIYLGPYSGQEFREKYLWSWLNTLKEGTTSFVDFSGTDIYSPSFLEESFGGVIRLAETKIDSEKNREKLKYIKYINIEKDWKIRLDGYIKDAIHDPVRAKNRLEDVYGRY